MYNEIFKLSENINGSLFKCQRCGACCSKDILRVQKGGMGIDYRGNYVKDPKISATLFTFEKPILERNIKKVSNIKPRFLPAMAFYMKAFKIGFVSLYQLPIKTDGSCYYYDNNLKKCKIYEIRPIACRIFPLTTMKTFPTLANDCPGVSKLISSIPSKKHHINLENPYFAPYRAMFSKESLMSEIYDFILEEHADIISILQPLFHDLYSYNIRFKDYSLYDLGDIGKWSEAKGRYRKLVKQYELRLKDLELSIVNKFRILLKSIKEV
ncbi:MAG: YkgJ family cysteine cluster protein [Promethearchaeota archaeon]